jgi:hypothetical protein
VAWVTEDPQGKAYFLEYTGQGLQSLETALKTKEEQMAIIGTRLLDVPKAGVEAADTYRMRNLGESNILAILSFVLSDAMRQALTWLAAWDYPGRQVDVTAQFTLDFDTSKLSAQELTALVAAYQSGAISWETFFYNVNRGELVPPDVDEETERKRLDESMMLTGTGKDTQPNDSGTAQPE